MDSIARTNKVLLLIATLVPFVLIAVFLALFFALIGFSAMQPGNANAEPSALVLIGFLGLQALMILWGIGLFVVYLVHLVKTERVPKDLKPLWGVILFLSGMIAMVVYWFLYVWPEPAPERI
jgi:hypothetical protein